MGRPEEIAGAATFLASDDASFVNGVECSSMAARRRSNPHKPACGLGPRVVYALLGTAGRSGTVVATDNSEYTGQCCRLRDGSYAGGQKAVFFFRPTLIYRESEG